MKTRSGGTHKKMQFFLKNHQNYTFLVDKVDFLVDKVDFMVYNYYVRE